MVEDIPPAPEFTESVSELFARVTKLVGRVSQSRDLKTPHPIIARLLADDCERLRKCSESGYLSGFDQPFYTSPYEQRRLKLLDAVFKAATRVGMSPSVQGRKNPGEFALKVGASSVGFTLDKPGEERSSWRVTSGPRRPASDPMHLKVGWWAEKQEGVVFNWVDGPQGRLEDRLNEVVVNLIVAAEMQVRIVELQWFAHRNRQKTELIEAERKRQAEALRQERERVERLNQARIGSLLQQAMALRLSDDIRGYVDAVNARNSAISEPISEPQLREWSSWALEQADRIDPVRLRSYLLPVREVQEEVGIEDEPSGSSPNNAAAPNWNPNAWYTKLHR